MWMAVRCLRADYTQGKQLQSHPAENTYGRCHADDSKSGPHPPRPQVTQVKSGAEQGDADDPR